MKHNADRNRIHRRRLLRGTLASLVAALLMLLPLSGALAQTQEEADPQPQAIVIVVVESTENEDAQVSAAQDAEEAVPTETTDLPEQTPPPEETLPLESTPTPDPAEQARVEDTEPAASEPDTQTQSDEETQTIAVANEYVFYSLDADAALALCGQYGGTLLRWSDGLGVMFSEAAFDNSAGLFYQQEIYVVSSAPYYEQPGETSTQIAAAQDLVPNAGAGVVIAVIDSGIDLDHPALVGNILDAVSVIPDSAYGEDGYFPLDYLGAQDYFGHGSHVSGILVGQTDELTIGIAPQAQVLSIKALEKYGSSAAGTTEWMIRAILYAISQHVDIINLSVGGGKNYVAAAQIALQQAADAGILVVAATGNSYTGPTEGIDYPAAYDNNLAVTSVTVEDGAVTISDFSRYGTGTDLSAPGVAIYSCNAEGQYVTLSGTSMSCAIVSGIAALLLSEDPGLTSTELSYLLKHSASDAGRPGYDTMYGWGVVDAKAALLLLRNDAAISGDWQADEASKPEIPTGPVVPADQDWIETQLNATQSAQQSAHAAADAAQSAEFGWILPLLGLALALFSALGIWLARQIRLKKQAAS